MAIDVTRALHRRVRRGFVAIALLLPGAIGLAAQVPAAQAVTVPPGGVTALPATEGANVVGQATLGEGGLPFASIEAPLLAHWFAGRPGIEELATLTQLGGVAGIEQAFTKALEQLADEAQLVEEMVGNWELEADFEEQLEAAYEASPAAKEPGAPESLEELVEQELEATPEELLRKGFALSMGELLSVWLGEAADPAGLAGGLFATIDSGEVEGYAGAALAGEPFVLADLEEVAQAAGLSSAELAEAMGRTPSELPAGARALLAPLSDGRELGVFVGSKSVSFAAFGPPPASEEESAEEPPSEETEEGEEGGSGGEEPNGKEGVGSGGGTPPPGAGGGSGAGTVPSGGSSADSLVLPAAGPSPGALPVPGVAPVRALSGVRILGHKARGGSVSVVLSLRSAGTLVLRGNGLRTVRHTSAGAGRVTIALRVTAATAASLRKHRRLKLKLQASFTPTAGAVSTAATSFVLS